MLPSPYLCNRDFRKEEIISHYSYRIQILLIVVFSERLSVMERLLLIQAVPVCVIERKTLTLGKFQ